VNAVNRHWLSAAGAASLACLTASAQSHKALPNAYDRSPELRYAWLAATSHDPLSAGTELAIFQEPWDPQTDLPDELPASVDLRIDFPDGAAAVVLVRDVIGSEAIIQTSDQIEWRMVLIDLKELNYPPPPTEDAACTYWRVKERIA
jgi:hypothetical protein